MTMKNKLLKWGGGGNNGKNKGYEEVKTDGMKVEQRGSG